MNEKTWKVVHTNLMTYIDRRYRKLNDLNVNRSASLEHEVKKSEIFTKLRYEGRQVLSEPVLNPKWGGLRPDLLVVDLLQPMAYEILNTETDKQFKEKAVKLPFRSIPIRLKNKEILRVTNMKR